MLNLGFNIDEIGPKLSEKIPTYSASYDENILNLITAHFCGR